MIGNKKIDLYVHRNHLAEQVKHKEETQDM